MHTITKIKKFGEDIDNKDDTQKMTFIEAAQLILKQNDNTPMSANEIWEQIEDLDLVLDSFSKTLHYSLCTICPSI